MTGIASETLEIGQDKILAHASNESLALVDVETYPVFVDKKADRLDLMAHLSNQMQALTAFSWKAPETARRFRFLLTENDFLVERIGRANPAQIASGNLRTYGQVALVTHEHLFDCARHRTHDLLRSSPHAKTPAPQILEVPPGVYSVVLYYNAPFQKQVDSHGAPAHGPVIDYTVIMRHYAFPPPRVAPVRLSAGFIPWAGEKAAAQAWGGRTSHKSPV